MLFINSSVTCQNLLQNGNFPIQPILEAIFVTIAAVKVGSITDLYTLAIELIN